MKEPVANTWNITASGSDANIASVDFQEFYNPSLVKYLSFEYKSATGMLTEIEPAGESVLYILK